MADCRRCGRKLSFFSPRDICSQCREAMSQFASQQGDTAVRRLDEPGIPVTKGLMAINFIVFLAMAFSGVSLGNPAGDDLFRWGANVGPLSLGSQPWRLLSANYVHGGIWHIAVNMWSLWSLGALTERIYGKFTYLLIYFACGISGCLFSIAWDPKAFNVGASGAIFGIAGALIAALYLGKLPLAQYAVQATLKNLVMVVGINLLIGAGVSSISNTSHVGGLACGLIMGAAMAGSLTAPDDKRTIWQLGVILSGALVLFSSFIYLRHKNAQLIYFYKLSQQSQSARLNDAIHQLENIVTEQPDNQRALLSLGQAYAQNKQFDKSATTFENLVKINPNDIDGQYYLGQAYMQLGRTAEAVKAFEKVVQAYPDDPDALGALSEAYRKAGNIEAANAAAKKVEELKNSQTTK
jgi:membrane associated rhomboid family serine protease/outer membrane protein assembly factor BamD (BamD/ComL family)